MSKYSNSSDRFPSLKSASKDMRDLEGRAKDCECMKSRDDIRASLKQLSQEVERAVSTVEMVWNLESEHNSAAIQGVHDEMNRRGRDLQANISELRRLMRALERNRSSIISLARRGLSGSNAGEDEDAKLVEFTDKLSSALESFRHRNGKSIEEMVDDIRKAKEMGDLYQAAERISGFILSITSNSASYRSLDDQATKSVHTVSQDLRAGVESWSSSRKRIYFLTGEAGLGKSSIAYQLCSRLDSAQESLPKLGASFFFAQKCDNLNSTVSLLAHLAYHIRPEESTRDKIEQILRNESEDENENNELDTHFLLLQDGLAAATRFSTTSPVAIVIDGLNECRDRPRIPALLRHLVALVRDFPWLYLFITSRPQPPIMTVLTHPSAKDILHHQHLNLENETRAVQRYLEYAVPKVLEDPDFPRMHTTALQRLINNARNSFDIAHLAIEYLDTEARSQQERLDHLRHRDLSRSSSRDFIHWEAVASASKTCQRRVVESIMRCVIFEHQDLTLDDISRCFYPTVPSDEVIATVDALRPVLRISESGIVLPTPLWSPDHFLKGLKAQPKAGSNMDLEFFDTSTHTAFTMLSTLLNTTPVTDILLTRLPPIAIHKDYPDVKHPSLSLWPRYLTKAPSTWPLKDALGYLIPSLAISLYAWVITFDELVRTGQALLAWEADKARRRRSAQFFRFAIFVQQWRDLRLQNGSRHTFEISSQDLRDEIISRFKASTTTGARIEAQEGLPTLPLFLSGRVHTLLYLDVTEDDLPHYRDIVQELVRVLEQDSRLASDVSLAGIVEGTYRIDSSQ